MYFYEGKEINEGILAEHPWLDYLYNTSYISVNMERVEVVEKITGKEALEYTLRTLDILKEIAAGKPYYNILERALQWCEVSKGGTYVQRDAFRQLGYPMDIHNLASAEIYKMQSFDSVEMTRIVYILIKYHGLVGQAIRGEVKVSENIPVAELLRFYDKDMLSDMLYDFNECIIRAASEKVWENIKEEVKEFVRNISNGIFNEYSAEERVRRLCSDKYDINDDGILFFENHIFPYYELWYFASAFDGFAFNEIIEILKRVVENNDANKVEHLNFKPLADSLHYDYSGRKHVNIYKKRIIEKYLRDGSNEHVDIEIINENNTLYIGFKFSPACEKLVDFCVEAERSGLITYEKAITAIFDMFGFRKDKFDRLNNEDKYLRTMNDASESTKSSIINYVEGKSVVDVGSGGGVMLDLLEEKYPDMKIIGTDISQNVISALKDKAKSENHKWLVKIHNFVDSPLDESVDNIIFSSILHEIFSYTETDGRKFNIKSVTDALLNARNSLNNGGRIIIRDGVKTDDDSILRVKFKTGDGIQFFKNFCNDFQGLSDIYEKKIRIISEKDGIVEGNINFMREFLYTYTWGSESYAHEVQEQFGYLTLPEYEKILKDLGFRIIMARAFLEPGYQEHLSPLVELYDGKDIPVSFPESNLIIIAEKITDT